MRWLFKTEPTEYSFERLVRDKKIKWDGVTNALALRHLRSVKKGDSVMIYHTGGVRAIVGLARVAADGPEIAPDRALDKPVALEAIKKNSKFKNFDLVRNGRLSVLPVPDELWDELLKLSS